MIQKQSAKLWILLIIGSLTACNNFLDIVPDNVATIDYAFRLRSTAERYLFTCYSYMPGHGDYTTNPAFAGGDEVWLPTINENKGWQIARGNQGVVSPYLGFWNGSEGAKDLYEGIRQCNIFLENIEKVPDMDESEKRKWISEVKFLKAYYHFWLVRMYGPIVLVKENLPVSSGVEEVRVARAPVDSCFSYIVELLDEAHSNLPDRIDNEVSELGRITKAINLAVKAQVLTTAASPLFNGNTDYQGFTNKEGTMLFSNTSDPGKWEKAAAACKEAIDYCESVGHKLYHYEPQFSQYDLSDSTRIKMSIRNAVCEKWNSEIIWANTNSMSTNMQVYSTPFGLDLNNYSNTGLKGRYAPPLKIVEMFYSNNGIPITEDKTWDYSGRFNLKIAGNNERYFLKQGYTTAKLNFDREPRFYASLGFDGSIWYGQGHFNDKGDDLLYVSAKQGDPASFAYVSDVSVTGYWTKKVVNPQNVIGAGNTYTIEPYPWPVIRLADLYLLYAESLNELNGPGSEVYQYIDNIRARAGIPPLVEAWSAFARNSDKVTTKDGLREIIHQERMIELAFEGKRFWDLRRWKKAIQELNKPITGWSTDQETAEGYYRERFIFNQTFTTRDYFWPLSENSIFRNNKLVQNPGW